MSIGYVLAFLVLVAAFVLWLMNRMDPTTAGMFAGLALAIMLSPFPIRLWPPSA